MEKRLHPNKRRSKFFPAILEHSILSKSKRLTTVREVLLSDPLACLVGIPTTGLLSLPSVGRAPLVSADSGDSKIKPPPRTQGNEP
jgi:hypothetical protein